MTDRKVGSATFWLVGIVLLVTAGGLFYAFGPLRDPDTVTVQFVFIPVHGTALGVTRTPAETEKLATETLTRAKEGEDFDKLSSSIPDISATGRYTLLNRGVTAPSKVGSSSPIPVVGRDEIRLPAFGDLSFKLRRGGVGMAPCETPSGLFGWHIIKRLE